MIKKGIYLGFQIRGIIRLNNQKDYFNLKRNYNEGNLRITKAKNKRENDVKLLESIRGINNNDIDNDNDIMNSIRSLPRYDLIKSNKEIKEEILNNRVNKENKIYDGLILQYYKIRNIFKFFKEGLLNVWRVNRSLKNKEEYGIFSGKRYLIDYSKGYLMDGKYIIKRKDVNKIINELSERIQLMKIEYDNGKRDELINKKDLLINRKEFIEMIRDKDNFSKLPIFGILFLIFEEFSLPLIYIFPNIIPSTCILPGIISKRYYSKNLKGIEELKKLMKLTDNNDTSNDKNERECREYVRDIAMNKISAFSIDDKLKRKAVCHTLGCRGTTAAALHERQKILLVDDALIVCGGGVSAMSDAEVVHGCVLRGVVSPLGGHDKSGVAGLRQQLENWLVVRFV
ncbi:hypothetical protein C6P42_003836 [Pichia californica]|nr:hypothetical protein C6P42_003836 [[Candida] californica]